VSPQFSMSTLAKSTHIGQLRSQRGVLGARILRILGSGPMTVALVVAFALQATWVAVSARSDIYDEPYHLAAIKAFSTRWTPFIHQTAADGPLGDIERYGSYLYHYLLSFPYRAAEALGLGSGATLVTLRMFSVLAVSGALVYSWLLFRELGAGRVTANVALAVVTMMPLAVFLAGTLNYDNLLALLSAAFFYYGLKLYKADHFDVGLWLKVLLVGGFAAVTKFTFLALTPVVVVALFIRQVPMLRSGLRTSSRDFFFVRGRGLIAARVFLALGVVVASTLVIERYGLNLLHYGTPLPSCLHIHPTGICGLDAPSVRNSTLDLAFKDLVPSLSGAVSYLSHQWIPLMLRYVTLIGTVGPDGAIRTSLGPHIFGAILTIAVTLMLGLVVLAITVLRSVRGARMLFAAAALYTFVLFAQNYHDYTKLGQPIGVQGRYVLVVLPIVVGLACIALARVISAGGASARPRAAVSAVVILAFVLSQGGGVTTYLWAGDQTWWRTDSGVRFAVAGKASHLAHLLVIPDTLIPDPRL
jgi:Predicted membrane protein (DUF2142)